MEDPAQRRLRVPPMGLANPAWVYAAIWLVILGLYQLHLTTVLQRMTRDALTLVAVSVGEGLLLSFLVYALLPRLRPHTIAREARELGVLYRWRAWALTIWAIGSVFEIGVSRGVPLVWLLMGVTSRDYRDFGVFSLHGFLTSLYFFSTAVTAVEIFLHGRSAKWRWLFLLFGWQILLVNRGGLVWVLLQVTGVFLLCRPLRGRFLLGAGAALLVGIMAFGVLGDARTGAGTAEFVRKQASPEGQVLVEYLPSGFLWVYLYTTTPINNIVGGLGKFEPAGTLFFSVQALLPTVIRDRIFNRPDLKFPVGLVNEAFNTSTWFVSFLADFGQNGALIGSGLLLLIAIVFYRYARVWRPWAIVGYSACFQGIVLSAFADTFTSLVTVAQLVMALALAAAAAHQERRFRQIQSAAVPTDEGRGEIA